MTYYQDLGADAARVSAATIAKLVSLSLAAAIGGVVPGVGTPAQAAARAELVTLVRAIPIEDRIATLNAAEAAGGNRVELQRAADAAAEVSNLGTKLANAGGIAVGAWLLFGSRR